MRSTTGLYRFNTAPVITVYSMTVVMSGMMSNTSRLFFVTCLLVTVERMMSMLYMMYMLAGVWLYACVATEVICGMSFLLCGVSGTYS